MPLIRFCQRHSFVIPPDILVGLPPSYFVWWALRLLSIPAYTAHDSHTLKAACAGPGLCRRDRTARTLFLSTSFPAFSSSLLGLTLRLTFIWLMTLYTWSMRSLGLPSPGGGSGGYHYSRVSPTRHQAQDMLAAYHLPPLPPRHPHTHTPAAFTGCLRLPAPAPRTPPHAHSLLTRYLTLTDRL